MENIYLHYYFYQNEIVLRVSEVTPKTVLHFYLELFAS